MLIEPHEFSKALEDKIKKRLEVVLGEIVKGRPQDTYHQLCGAHRELSMYVPNMIDEVLKTYRESEDE